MSRLKILMTLISILHGQASLSQIADDFSDGDFQSAPVWQGDAARFVVSGGRLKLQAPAVSGSAQLVTPSKAIQEASWEFSMQLDFTPSSTNYAKVFLVSDSPDFLASLNGYFVKVGNSSREISLYRQTGNTELEIIDGADDRVNQPVVILRVRVTRSASGTWELFSDVGQSGAFVLEGSVTDENHTVSEWFGVHCIYTATRSDKFWFDEFVVTGSIVPDTSPPTIVKIEALNPLLFTGVFSEPLESVSATTSRNVSIAGLGSPATSVLLNEVTVLWSLVNPLTNGVTYQVEFSGFSDRAGNRMSATFKSLLYFIPGVAMKKSALITEIFPDPTPQLGLPSAEFVEIFNRSEDPFDLTHWELSDDASTGVLPAAIILPGEYIVITAASSVSLFHNSGRVIGISNFPSLNNNGDAVALRDPEGTTIDSVRYAVDWFGDEDKAQGGWSLELIDLNNPCGQADNWAASEDERGGTPGMVNSIAAEKPDHTPPTIVSVQSLNTTTYSITFNEVLMSSSDEDAKITMVPEVPIFGVYLRDPARRTIEVELLEALQRRIPYEVTVRDIRDCNGNIMESASRTFGLPEPADSLDVIINELLFNPRPGGADFVELFNASEKFIDLSGWMIGNGETRSTMGRFVLQPHQFVVLTTDPLATLSQYPLAAPNSLVKSLVPNFPDDKGSVQLEDDHGSRLDQLTYSRAWHSEFLRNDEGVSLERIDVRAPTQQESNWISASSMFGFATPGYPNSQQRSNSGTMEEVQVVPEIFTPGMETLSFVQIYYHFEQPGQMANVKVVNYHGAIVKYIANNELLGSEGFLRWEGDQDNGARVVAGYYILWFETFDAAGNVSTFRKRIVIAGR